jgi:hypothetical protein
MNNLQRLERDYGRIMKLLSPTSEHPGKHFTAANKLIVDMAEVGMDTTELMERLYFLTEGWAEKDTRSASKRMRAILNPH